MITIETSAVVVDAIKNWMKANPGKLVPNSKKVLNDTNICLEDSFDYTDCRHKAYKELENEGFKVEYLDTSKIVACLVLSKPDVDIKEKMNWDAVNAKFGDAGIRIRKDHNKQRASNAALKVFEAINAMKGSEELRPLIIADLLRRYERYGLADLVEAGWNWKPKEGKQSEGMEEG